MSAWLLDRMVHLYKTDLKLMPGAGELLAAIIAAGVPVALVSSSYRVLVDAVLAQGFGPFALTLAGDEVVHSKPHPDRSQTEMSGLSREMRSQIGWNWNQPVRAVRVRGRHDVGPGRVHGAVDGHGRAVHGPVALDDVALVVDADEVRGLDHAEVHRGFKGSTQ